MGAEHALETAIPTGEVAHAIGVCKTTLLRWIRTGYIPEPPFVQVGRVRVRMWRKVDIARALQHRVSYYKWTRWQINESEKQARRLAGTGAGCGTRTAEPNAAQS
jgi:predicted site-specific integrase-resolvase